MLNIENQLPSSARRLIGTAVLALALTLAAGGALAQGFFGGYATSSGKETYEHICQGCHMPDAKGAVGAGAYPALAGNKKLIAAAYPALVIIKGQKAMPSFGMLSDVQIADVVNYVRSNFGNQFPGAITPEQVKALRPGARGPGAPLAPG
jgi:mono/diheme cytochrome c family protein